MIDRAFVLTMSSLISMLGLSLSGMQPAAAVSQAATSAGEVSTESDAAEPPPAETSPAETSPAEPPRPRNPDALEGTNPFGEANPLSKVLPSFVHAPVPAEGETYELSEEGELAKANYEAAKQELVEATIEMRRIHTLYMNAEEQSTEALERFRESRSETRLIFDKVFDAAYQYLLAAPDEEAVQYLLTMLDHRYKASDYSESSLVASALLIDLGFNSKFLYHSAARASICTGEFETARRVYAELKPEDLEDTDRRLAFQLDEIQEQWLVEQERRAEDAKAELPRVKLKTTRGDIVLELFLEDAPSTVAHFIKLVEDGYYDGLDFYQVVDDLLALTGDETGSGSGNSGQFLIDEHERDGARDAFRGSLAMAKLPKNDQGEFLEHSGSSQFAIFYTPLPGVSKV
ncbi:MAG: peptidylprolyl isomerase, partial [Novipirellula sp. JB048]